MEQSSIDHHRRQYAAGCLALITMALTFSIRTDIIPSIKAEFGFTDAQIGQAMGPSYWAFGISIFVAGLMLDKIGMGRLLWLSFIGYIAAVILTIKMKTWNHLFCAQMLVGLSSGMVEGVINPLTTTLYPHNKTRYLNLMHSWWPGGMVIGGLASYALTKAMHLDAPGMAEATLNLGWRIKWCLILIPALVYGILLLGQKFPQTERVASGLTYTEMAEAILRPLFWCLVFLMVFTAATELGPDQWISNLVQNLLGEKVTGGNVGKSGAGAGVLVLVYTSGLVFILRAFLAAPLLRIFSPVGLMIASCFTAAVGLFWLGSAQSGLVVMVAATLFGIGKAYLWPTMMGLCSERVPRGGALALGLLGSAGTLSVGLLSIPYMGTLQDHFAVKYLQEYAPAVLVKVATPDMKGMDEKAVQALPEADAVQIAAAKKYSAVMSFRWVAIIPFLLTFCFIAMATVFKSQGGYTAVRIDHAPASGP